MIDQQQSPAPFAPWLPAPTPRVVAPTTAPPNPWARIASASEHNPPPKARKRRGPTVPALLGIVVLIAAGAAANYAKPSDESTSQQVAAPVTIPTALDTPVNAPFAVQTEAFSFVLPATPAIRPSTLTISGMTGVGTQWTLDIEDPSLVVVAVRFDFSIDEVAQQGAFNEMAANMAARIEGTVASDTWSTTDGVYQSDSVIVSLGGTMVLKGYFKGNWVVMIVGVGHGTDSPPGFADLLASFSFV